MVFYHFKLNDAHQVYDHLAFSTYFLIVQNAHTHLHAQIRFQHCGTLKPQNFTVITVSLNPAIIEKLFLMRPFYSMDL